MAQPMKHQKNIKLSKKIIKQQQLRGHNQ